MDLFGGFGGCASSRHLHMAEIPFRDLPIYSYDYDADFPPAARAFKNAIPEYNRSIPGGLKNAIDWASRPYEKNSFARTPSAVIGTSPGAIGSNPKDGALWAHFCVTRPRRTSRSPSGSRLELRPNRLRRMRESKSDRLLAGAKDAPSLQRCRCR